MITILGTEINSEDLLAAYKTEVMESNIINLMQNSKKDYRYKSVNQLKFEINMRTNIITASKELNDSRLKFKTFDKSYCNSDYWKRTKNGGFVLKDDVNASEAIEDIFNNSSKYATECSTAIIILYYKALLGIYPEDLFNRLFSNIFLLNWHYADGELAIYTRKVENDFLPGDCRYFENPDFHPDKSEWRGENAIDLGDTTYFGHGIGIKNTESIIESLNKNRKKDASESAYLTNYVTNPNYKHLANVYLSLLSRMRQDCYRSYFIF